MADVTVEHRREQAYLGITVQTTMATLAPDVLAAQHELFGVVRAAGAVMSGVPFWRYLVIDMAGTMQIEVGLPVESEVEASGSDRVHLGVLPAGRYATTLHTGHPDGLMQATGELLDWATQNNLLWDVDEQPDGEHWGARLEEYLTDPDEQPDLQQWQTRLAFRLAD